jgi:Glycosyl hydrolase family 9
MAPLSMVMVILLSVAIGGIMAGAVAVPNVDPVPVDFTKAARMSLDFLDAQRSGDLPEKFSIPWRSPSGVQNKVSVRFGDSASGKETLLLADLTGGFYNGGEVGQVKVTSHVALVTPCWRGVCSNTPASGRRMLRSRRMRWASSRTARRT